LKIRNPDITPHGMSLDFSVLPKNKFKQI
jgi:hypothetical protein